MIRFLLIGGALIGAAYFFGRKSSTDTDSLMEQGYNEGFREPYSLMAYVAQRQRPGERWPPLQDAPSQVLDYWNDLEARVQAYLGFRG